MKKPWAFIRVPYIESYYLGVIGPGFLNQVPPLESVGFYVAYVPV